MFAVKTHLPLSTAHLTIAVFFFLSQSGCGWIRQATGEEKPLGLSPTGLGAAAGAVVGSGVGAIIGSQSGNAGIGVAIGGLSGAALGGALGQQEERELHSKKEHNVGSDRQDELLKANQNRINEYKRGSDLAGERRGALASPKNSPKSFGKSSLVNTPSGYRGNPRAISLSEIVTTPDVVVPKVDIAVPKVVASTRLPVVRSNERIPAKLGVESVKANIVKDEMGSVTRVVSKNSQVDLVPEAKKENLEVKKVLPTLVEQKLPAAKSLEPVVAPESEVNSADDSMKAEINKATTTNGIVGVPVQAGKATDLPVAEEIKTTVITGSKVVKSAPDDDCSRADQEYQRATTSISDADKLFYLRRALRLCSAKPNLHLATGRVYTKLGRIEDAEYEFRQVLDLEPNNSEASKELATLKQGVK